MAAETLTVTVADKDGNTIYQKTSLTASNTTTVALIDANNYPLQLPLSGDTTVTATLTGGTAPSGASVGVVLLIENA